MRKATGIFLFLLSTLAVCPGTEAKRKNKKAAQALAALAKDTTNTDYKKLPKGAQTQKGLFTTLYNAKEGKLYFEIPDSAFNQIYILANRVAATSDTRDFVAGQIATQPLLIRFTKDERNVYMHEVQSDDMVSPTDPIHSAFKKNFYDPVLKGFKIAAQNGKNTVIDVTAFFAMNEKSISPIKTDNPISKLLGASNSLKGTFVPDASGIISAKSFPGNIEIESRLSFTLTPMDQPYSVIMHRSIFALPDDPMPMRFQDNRVGYFYSDKSIFTSDQDKLDQRTFIHRWRLEPKEEDLDRYFNGEKVEPKKPIIFYVDSAFPEKWRTAIHQGIEDWNTAFEQAGFKNAIKAVDYPKNDPDFDPDDMRYSCFKYAASSTANAMGPSHVDPRTGEILTADVIWYHNIISLLHNWRFVQTGAVDPRVRKQVFDADVMRESIRYAAAHEIGHTLGLMHNMGASYAFPVDSLRSPSFTQQYGTTPSIMDYARNNFVAQPGDVEKGVKLTPPTLGVYDIYAINWGYRIIPNATTPQAEKPTLDQWIAAKAGDPMYEFGAQQVFSTIDPTDQTEDLGNDHIKAGNYGISNLKIIMQNLESWDKEDGERYDDMENMYREIVNQYTRYLRHVMPYIGGIRFEEVRQGDGKTTSKHYIDRDTQHKAMLWLLDQARTYDSWLTLKDLIAKFELNMNVNDKLQSMVITSLINSATLYRIQEGGLVDPTHNYNLNDYMNDVTDAIFKAPSGGKLSDTEQNLQSTAIAIMLNNTGLIQKPKAATTSSLGQNAGINTDDMTENEYYCSSDMGEENKFTRIKFGLPTLSKEQLGALMTGRQHKVLSLYKARRAAATGSTKDFYDYQILLIERTFAN
ncbi:MAG: zinc-dependent metalloprotease [Paraprevotella sp.]|nr:zinc-dependent metalloprotease [Paraprevotella sp.]